MHWNSLFEFLNMGGYALYVWGSFGATALVLSMECWWVKRANAQAQSELEAAQLSLELQA
jgi:heme exporter protein D